MIQIHPFMWAIDIDIGIDIAITIGCAVGIGISEWRFLLCVMF